MPTIEELTRRLKRMEADTPSNSAGSLYALTPYIFTVCQNDDERGAWVRHCLAQPAARDWLMRDGCPPAEAAALCEGVTADISDSIIVSILLGRVAGRGFDLARYAADVEAAELYRQTTYPGSLPWLSDDTPQDENRIGGILICGGKRLAQADAITGRLE